MTDYIPYSPSPESSYAASNITEAALENLVTNVTTATDNITRDVIVKMSKYGLPVVIVFGLLGNAFSFWMFVRSSLRHQSSSVYLACLNFADFVFLLCLGSAQLDWYGVHVTRVTGLCQIVIYLSYISGFLSVWTVVAFTVERFIVVYFPLRRLALCTKQKARYVVISLLCVALVIYNFALWTSRVVAHPIRGHPQCMVVKRYAHAVHVLSMVDTCVTMVLPSLAIVLINILIVIGVWRFVRRRRALQEDGGKSGWGGGVTGGVTGVTGVTDGERRSVGARHSGATASGEEEAIPLAAYNGERREAHEGGADGRYPPPPDRNADSPPRGATAPAAVSGRRRASSPALRPSPRAGGSPYAVQLRTTRTLLIISTVFVVLNLPSHAFRVWAALHPQGDQPSESLLITQLALQFLYYLNFSCNLLMYCVCIRTFREAVVVMVTDAGRRVTASLERLCSPVKARWCAKTQ